VADNPDSSSSPPLISLSALGYTLVPPLIVWGAMVAAATFGGQPGVICITPVAWLLALWCGGEYIRRTGGREERWPMFAPALVGAVLGLCMGLFYILLSSQTMPVGTAPDEIAKAQTLDITITAGGVLACAVLSMITAWLTLRRYRLRR
jgi:hypothetical protein